MNINALKEYKSVDLRATVATATPHQLISMSMRGVLEALAKARGAVERKDIELRTHQINKATDILMYLNSCLDSDQGGEIADNLSALYIYMVRRLAEANRENSAEKLTEVSKLLTQVFEGWSEMPVEYQNAES